VSEKTEPDTGEMTAQQFRDALQGALRSRSLKILADYLDQVDGERATMAEKHRFMEWAVKTLGAESEKKQSLPVVNIQIGMGGQITATAVLGDESQTITLVPTAKMMNLKTINADVVEVE
jgi:hypothetical protein